MIGFSVTKVNSTPMQDRTNARYRRSSGTASIRFMLAPTIASNT